MADVTPRDQTVWRFSYGKHLAGAAGCAAFGLLGVPYALDTGDWPVGAIGGFFALVIAPLNVFQARRQLVVLLDDGLWYRSWAGTTWVPWKSIDDARIKESRGPKHIEIVVADSEGVEIPRAVRILHRLGPRPGSADFTISTTSMRDDPKELMWTILRRTALAHGRYAGDRYSSSSS